MSEKADPAPDAADLVLIDDGGLRSHVVGVDGDALLLLDPNLRVVLATRSWPESATLRAQIHIEPDAQAVRTQAPVLLVPDVLSADLREALVEAVRRGDGTSTGVHREQGASLDSQLKRRLDYPVGAELVAQLTTAVARRLLPEVRRAFHYAGNRFEGFKLVRYGAEEGGFFGAHRDNLASATAHRRFAITMVVNDGFEGGGLVFPEYGHAIYYPDAGGACVFSGSLLHEVLPVTAGERIAVLTFIYDEGALRAGQPG